jgi:hypothetical protein
VFEHTKNDWEKGEEDKNEDLRVGRLGFVSDETHVSHICCGAFGFMDNATDDPRGSWDFIVTDINGPVLLYSLAPTWQRACNKECCGYRQRIGRWPRGHKCCARAER